MLALGASQVRLASCIDACPTVRAVVTFQRFPELCGFSEPETVQCETTWTAPREIESVHSRPGSTVHIYMRTAKRAVLLAQPDTAPNALATRTAGGDENLLMLEYDSAGRTQWCWRMAHLER